MVGRHLARCWPDPSRRIDYLHASKDCIPLLSSPEPSVHSANDIHDHCSNSHPALSHSHAFLLLNISPEACTHSRPVVCTIIQRCNFNAEYDYSLPPGRCAWSSGLQQGARLDDLLFGNSWLARSKFPIWTAQKPTCHQTAPIRKKGCPYCFPLSLPLASFSSFSTSRVVNDCDGCSRQKPIC